MSDAMTNREIEDVLTSIRRLVAQDGTRALEASRLILTPAQRVETPVDTEILADGPLSRPALPDSPPDPVFDPVPPPVTGSGPRSRVAGNTADRPPLPEPDFRKLEATIAELEAAVTASGGTWEAETPDESPRASNVTELYGRLSFAHRNAAEALPMTLADAAQPATATPAFEPPAFGPARPAKVAQDTAPAADTLADAPAEVDDIPILELPPIEPLLASERLAAPLSPQDPVSPQDPASEDTLIDETILRNLIAQIVREELHGALGEKITQQVRKLVRTEIAKALDDRKFL